MIMQILYKENEMNKNCTNYDVKKLGLFPLIKTFIKKFGI